jgi:catechol 2,3-dioxygenase-like lactoylglutathione lyase family enzyme
MATPVQYERATEDIGGIVALEHVNTTVPDQRLGTLFYVVGMGFTRDPYLSVGDENMWFNLGQQQFHTPTRAAQVLRGHVGIVVPDLEALEARLAAVREKLAGTRFAYERSGDHVRAISPWGNELRCYAPSPRFGSMVLGMPYVEFTVSKGTAAGIARFYQKVFDVAAETADGGTCASVPAGPGQTLYFREQAAPLPAYDGHHIAVYIADFSGPHRFLKERGLITEESNRHQYRFKTLCDPDTGAPLFEIEHEVRSLTHPLWARPFVNRNPYQTQRNYVPGRDAFCG